MNKIIFSVATALCFVVNAFAQESRSCEEQGCVTVDDHICRCPVVLEPSSTEIEIKEMYSCKNMDLPEDSANIAFPSMVINFPSSLDKFFFFKDIFDSIPEVKKNWSCYGDCPSNFTPVDGKTWLEYTSSLDSSVYVKVVHALTHYENNKVQLWRKCAPGTWLSENSSCDAENFEHSFEDVLLYDVEQWAEKGWLSISKDSAFTLVNDKLVRMKEADKRGDLYGMVYNPNCEQYVVGGRLDVDTVLFTLYYGQNSHLDSLYRSDNPLAIQPTVSKMPFHQLQKTCSGYEIIFGDSKAHKVRFFSMTVKLLTEENAIGQYEVPVMNATVILQVDAKITKLLR